MKTWWRGGNSERMGHGASAACWNVAQSGEEEAGGEGKLDALRRAVLVYSSATRVEKETASSSSLEGVRAAIDAISCLEDVGLSLDRVQRAIERSSGPYQRMGSKPVILYRGIHEDERFSLGVFCIPDGGVIPLHDHPDAENLC